ncbi:MAG: ribulose-phosphate 3-epimerase [bacterium]
MDYAQHTANGEMIILPSLLAADFGYLADGVRQADHAGADGVHLDIMDAHFVPNLSMGPDVVAMANRTTEIPLSVHLMMSKPAAYLERFIKAGADILLIHIEIEGDIPGMLRQIRQMGARPGITLNPDTPAEAVYDVLPDVDEVLCMTVYPGYGGQTFMDSVVPKIRKLRTHIKNEGLRVDVNVDGGIDMRTVRLAAAAGANVFVAGTSLYRAANMPESVAAMRATAAQLYDSMKD